jgi:anti-sigma factor RsiW
MDERTLELMNLAVDGQATTDEQIELHTRLEQNPEAQVLFDEMRHFARELDSQPHPEPPPETRQNVLAAISASSRPKVVPFSPRRKAFIAAYAVAAAVILGVALYPVLLDRPSAAFDPSDAAGTMAPRSGSPAADPTLEWPEIVSTGLPDAGALAVARQQGDRVALEVKVPFGKEVTVRWAGAPLAVLTSPAGSRATGNSVSYPAESNQRTTLIFSAPAGAASVDFEVLLDGNELLTVSAPLD